MSIDDTTPEATDDGRRPGIPRWLKWGALGLIGLVVVGYGVIFLYAKVINDSPDEFDEGDLDSALAITEPSAPGGDDDTATAATDAPAASDPPVSTDPPAATTEPARTDEAPVPPDGVSVWTVTDASELGYRVDEVLFGVNTAAVGRTNQITGSMSISGTTLTDAEFVVDVASITSDESRRDGRFRGSIMSTTEFPTATFALSQPIELGTEPSDGAGVTTTVAGELTLRGVTNDVTFELTARQEGDRIGVLGNIPVVFADYGIGNPSVPGITTEDNGLLEFVLVFEPAT
jgi:polyisoprenoid-binding protein YceI